MKAYIFDRQSNRRIHRELALYAPGQGYVVDVFIRAGKPVYYGGTTSTLRAVTKGQNRIPWVNTNAAYRVRVWPKGKTNDQA